MGKHRLPLRTRMRRSLKMILPVGVLAAGMGFAGGALAGSHPPAGVSYLSPALAHVPEKPAKLPVIVTLVNYQVRPGDSLWGISAAHCPSPSDWRHLQHFSKISNPDEIYPGEIITLAC